MPKRTCNHPACGELTTKGSYCAEHQKAIDKRIADRKKAYDDRRLSSTQRGYDCRWRKKRAAWLLNNPLCVICKSKGIVKPATELDHIIPHRGNRELFEDDNNLQGLCKSCHSRKTARGE